MYTISLSSKYFLYQVEIIVVVQKGDISVLCVCVHRNDVRYGDNECVVSSQIKQSKGYTCMNVMTMMKLYMIRMPLCFTRLLMTFTTQTHTHTHTQ